MRKVLSTLVLTAFAMAATAQNVQLHYDLGKDRGYPTATVEFFKPDAWGSTFFFVDFDLNGKKNDMNLSYMEISRNLKLSENIPVQLHLEYNGGLWGNSGFGGAISNSYLVGGYYDLKITDGFTLGTMLAYKHIQNSNKSANFQFTGTWFKPFAKNFLFTGFMDLWSQESPTSDGRQLVFLTEPQLWYSLGKNFKVGTEVEISRNFVSQDKFQINPTLAVRWDFQ